MLNLKNHRNPVWFSLKLFLTVGVFVFPTSQGTIENNEFNKDIQSRSRFISKVKIYSPPTKEVSQTNSQPANDLDKPAPATKCNKPPSLPTTTDLYKVPTILKGSLIEAVSMPPKHNRLFLFEISQIIRINGNSKATSIEQHPLSIPMPNANQLLQSSHTKRMNSYVLVDESALGCSNETLNIGADYFLFLNQFRIENITNTHPIRYKNANSSIPRNKPGLRELVTRLVKIRGKRDIKVHSIDQVKGQRDLHSPNIVLVKVHIFKSLHRPIQVSHYKRLKSDVQHILCSSCERPVSLNIQQKVHKANINQDIKLFCSFSGNPEPEIFWKKFQQTGRIANNFKYTIEKISSYSILTIKSVNENDAGIYWCFTKNSVSKATNLTSSKTRLVVNSENKYRPTTKAAPSPEIDSTVLCEPSENTCMNGGLCMKSNPKLNSIFRKKFCRCHKEYEGPNCEIKIVTAIADFDLNDIPIELRPLWYKLGKKVSNKNAS